MSAYLLTKLSSVERVLQSEHLNWSIVAWQIHHAIWNGAVCLEVWKSNYLPAKQRISAFGQATSTGKPFQLENSQRNCWEKCAWAQCLCLLASSQVPWWQSLVPDECHHVMGAPEGRCKPCVSQEPVSDVLQAKTAQPYCFWTSRLTNNI